MHRFAIVSARAAECAGMQGHFESMHGQLFEGQSEFGLRPWRDFAMRAGVEDLQAFDACVSSDAPAQRILTGRHFGDKLEIRSTPTLIVNGWRLNRPPDAKELDLIVKNILAGRKPI